MAAHLLAAAEGIDAPHLVDVEAAHVLRRLVSRGDISVSLDAQLVTCDARLGVAAGGVVEMPVV